MKFSLFIVIVCTFSMPSIAQDSPSVSTRDYDSALKKLQLDYRKQRAKLDGKYVASERALRDALIESLTATMVAAAKDVDLKAANELKSQIDGLTAKQALPSQFRELDRTRNMRILESFRRGKIPDELVGEWQGRWGTTGNRIFLRVVADGVFYKGDAEKSFSFLDGRLLHIPQGNREGHEIVPFKDGLLVLGWSDVQRASPVGSTPNHVGFVKRNELP